MEVRGAPALATISLRAAHRAVNIQTLTPPPCYNEVHRIFLEVSTAERYATRPSDRLFQALLLIVLILNGPAWEQTELGGSKIIEVTAENLNQHPFRFRVSTIANPLGLPNQDSIRFIIEVAERDQLSLLNPVVNCG